MAPGTRPAGVARGARRGAVGLAAAARDLAVGPETRAVVLVEGSSDRIALEVLADRRGHDLAAEGVAIVPMGGVTSLVGFLDLFGPTGLDVRLAGMCDAGEEPAMRRALERARLGTGLDRAGMERLGFAVCVEDLEDELIRALGTNAVEAVIDRRGDLASFSRFVRQPAQRDRPRPAQLRRFMGTRSGRKSHYAALLTDALDLDAMPRPLDLVLAHV